MKKMLLLILLSQLIFATSGLYTSSRYTFCDSKKSLDKWTQFDVDNDTASKRAYHGVKCFTLNEDIRVSGIETHWGKVSFIYKGHQLWGYKEGLR